MKNYLTPLILSSLFFTSAYAYTPSEQMHTALVGTCVKIMIEQPQSIEAWIGDRFYLKTDHIHLTKEGIFVENEGSSITLPGFEYDQNGLFMLCSKEDAEKEAQEHYDNAVDSVLEALQHSMNAGLGIIQCPPIAIIEIYQACEARDRDGYADAQDRDRRDN